ncbi:MAG TPA: hypothetical protein VL361_28570 [Candidatus Limnocylindrales bacterium]|jgi:hypothetical protein|nr:hypothetical protein [Candidatus Limnocylindrales bacterium]
MKISTHFKKPISQLARALPLCFLLGGLGMAVSAAAVTVDTPTTDTVPNSVQPAPVPLGTEHSVPKYSAGVQDVLQMLDAKVDLGVIKEYIKNSTIGYDLNAEEIVALKKRGVPDEIVTGLLQRGAEVRAQVATSASTARPPYNTQAPYAPNAQAPYGPYYGYDYGDYNPNYSSAYVYPYDYSYGYPYNYWWYSYSYPWWGYWPFFYYVDSHGHHHYYHHDGHYDGHYNGHHGNWNAGSFHGGHNSGMSHQNRPPFGTFTGNRSGFANTGTRSPFGTYMPQRSVSRPATSFGTRPMAYAGRTAGFGGRPASFGSRPASFGGHVGGMRSGGGFGGRAGGGGHR